jgi:hypothetical protein
MQCHILSEILYNSSLPYKASNYRRIFWKQRIGIMKNNAYKRPDLKNPQQTINENFKQVFQWRPHRWWFCQKYYTTQACHTKRQIIDPVWIQYLYWSRLKQVILFLMPYKLLWYNPRNWICSASVITAFTVINVIMFHSLLFKWAAHQLYVCQIVMLSYSSFSSGHCIIFL